MAQIDFSTLLSAFNGLAVNNLDHKAKLSSSAAHYSWETTGGYIFTALSLDNDITASGTAPTGGSVDAINVMLGNIPAFSITGLDVGLTSLVDVNSAANSLAKFWKAVLAGETTFVMPGSAGAAVTMLGDFVDLSSGQTATGGNDQFLGSNLATKHALYGDAATVKAGATLTGGNDQFQGVAGFIAGDVGGGSTNLGTIHGGNDTVTATGTATAPTLEFDEIIGDVEANRGKVLGGADKVELTDIKSVHTIVGDVLHHDAGSVAGGDDDISIRKTAGFDQLATFFFIMGDVNQSAAGASVTGGDDILTVKDATGSAISGDIMNANANANVDGGDDTIVVASSAPLYGGPPAAAPTVPTVTYVDGDARTIGSSATLAGGRDTITILNAAVSNIVVGDVRNGQGTAHVGGDDKVAFSWTQTNIAAPSFIGSGDFDRIDSGSATGGDDTLSVNHSSNMAAASVFLFGEATSFDGFDDFVGGDDVITVNSNRSDGTSLLVGDVLNVNTQAAFRGGNDTIIGSSGADQIFGDADNVTASSHIGGNDILNGRGGNDVIDGGLGNDTAVYSSLAQSVFVNLNGIAGSAANPANWVEAIGQGSDQLFDIENVVGSSLDDTIIGDGLANRLAGGAGNDKLDGGGGNDTLTGGAGTDKLTGGAGDDTYVLENGSDMTVDTGGTDTITSTISRSLASYAAIERLTLTGAAAINGAGNALANIITGNAANNVLDGGTGADTLVGGAGNDTYVLDNGNDIVTDTGGTADTITSTISRALAGYATIERLTLTGSANVSGAGNGLANVITGNAGNNILDGGAGTDRLVGGAGNDTYVLANGSDVVVDASGTADMITSTISRSLANYAAIEKLSLLGTANINGTGNGLANIVTGNAGNNVLDGGAGNDRLVGGTGNDTYVLANGGDVVVDTGGTADMITSTISRSLAGYATIEKLALLGTANVNGAGNALANTITGNAANNVLNGGAGADTLVGGAGNDTYVLADGADAVTDTGGTADTITSTISRSLASYATIEKLTLLGTAAINGAGNGLANIITGNAGNNILNGGLGKDVLTGGAGNDSFRFDTALSAANFDRITDFSAPQDTIVLENAIFKGLAAGTLAATAFVRNTTGLAADANDRIVYETDTGKLFYDGNGNAAGGSVHFATLSVNLALTNADFLVT